MRYEHFLFKQAFTYLLTSVIALSNIACKAQDTTNYNELAGRWNVNLVHDSTGDLQFLMDFKTNNNKFEAYSRRRAAHDILGLWNTLIAQTFSENFKSGSLLRIENGEFENSNDTIYIKGQLISTIGKLKIEGFFTKNKLQSTLKTYSNKKVGRMSGNRNIPSLPLNNYNKLLSEIFTTTENNIYNKDLLRNKAWKRFKIKLNSGVTKFEDDLDMIFAFYYHSINLPFSHFSLTKTMKSKKTSNRRPEERNLTLKQKNSDIAYLKISSFGGTSQEVDSIFKIINEKEYTQLIVDLRNNSGGNVEAGITFAANVLDTVSYGGVFLTQKWFNKRSRLPQIKDYDQFAHFSEANNDLILEGIHKTKGLCLKVIPKEKPYKGQLYILVNKNTASTCEPIVYELKKQERAVIIGETTAGAMLSSETFGLDSGYKLSIPTADYYTSDGYKIDQNGVEPNIKSKNALKIALEKINKLKHL